MPLIEGVGDEVTIFFITSCIVIIGWIAWCSTNISEQPLIRTVLILQHRTRSRIAELRSNNHTISTVTTIVGSTNDGNIRRLSLQENTSEDNDETNIVETQQNNASSQVEDDNQSSRSSDTSSVTTEEVLIETMDSHNDDTNNINNTNNKIKKTNENTTNSSNNNYSQLNETAESSSPPIDNVDNVNNDDEITIKLKYINDDQKVVKAKPKELVGNFIKRNFQVELNAQKRIRLIFNGHVLHPDNETLEQCGLYNNCVVHCLVHQQRTQQNNNDTSQINNNDNTSSMYTGNEEFQNIQNPNGLSAVHNEWDLGRLLVSILTLILVVAWYSRYHYDQLFTVTTSLALYVLTAIFTLSVVGQVFQDQDTIRNIE